MNNQPTTTHPMTYTIKAVEIQDTPIESLYLQWSEDDGEYNCDVPLSWVKQVYDVRAKSLVVILVKSNPTLLIDVIKADDEFSKRVCRLKVDDSEPIPSVFLTIDDIPNLAA